MGSGAWSSRGDRHALAAREFQDRHDGVFLCEVHDHVAAILLRQRDAVWHTARKPRARTEWR